MAQRISFTASGSTQIIRARRVVYFPDFTTIAGVGSIRLMFRPIQAPWSTGNLWLPAAGPLTATPLAASEAGFNFPDSNRGVDWRVDCVWTSGTITVDFFAVEKGQ
jgi:hypothetical protein